MYHSCNLDINPLSWIIQPSMIRIGVIHLLHCNLYLIEAKMLHQIQCSILAELYIYIISVILHNVSMARPYSADATLPWPNRNHVTSYVTSRRHMLVKRHVTLFFASFTVCYSLPTFNHPLRSEDVTELHEGVFWHHAIGVGVEVLGQPIHPLYL